MDLPKNFVTGRTRPREPHAKFTKELGIAPRSGVNHHASANRHSAQAVRDGLTFPSPSPSSRPVGSGTGPMSRHGPVVQAGSPGNGPAATNTRFRRVDALASYPRVTVARWQNSSGGVQCMASSTRCWTSSTPTTRPAPSCFVEALPGRRRRANADSH
jgi:hypothetical protein